MQNPDTSFSTINKYDIRILTEVKCCEHLHFQTEIAIVIKGKLTIKQKSSETVLTSGHGILIMPYEIHGYKTDSDTEIIIMEFNRAVFEEFKGYTPYCTALFNIPNEVLEYIRFMLKRKKDSAVYLRSLIYPILNEIDFAPNIKGNEIYSRVFDYIDKYYDEKITLKSTAEEIGCSYVYLSRLFSKIAGISFTEYLNRYRIMQSLKPLTESDLHITEIAYQNGFETLRSYNREFKKIFNLTPSEYRKTGYKLFIRG